jgi:uncharacterized protein (DUF486 family)
MRTVILLVLSNIFMTIAWYGHLKHHRDSPLWVVILISWGIAFFEYCLMVPANRYGYGRFNLPQLKVIQEVVTLLVFGVFTVVWMRERLHINHLWAGLCLVGAVFFTFKR